MDNTATNSTDSPSVHEVLGYQDEDLAYERRYLGRRDSATPTRPLGDPTAREALLSAEQLDSRKPRASRYVWNGGGKAAPLRIADGR